MVRLIGGFAAAVGVFLMVGSLCAMAGCIDACMPPICIAACLLVEILGVVVIVAGVPND